MTILFNADYQRVEANGTAPNAVELQPLSAVVTVCSSDSVAAYKSARMNGARIEPNLISSAADKNDVDR